MAQSATNVPVKTQGQSGMPATAQPWWPLENLHREIDRLFNDFEGAAWRSPLSRSLLDVAPFRTRDMDWGAVPAVDVTESDKAYEISAELPGMDEKDIEVKLCNGGLMIKGEKQASKEEQKTDYYLHERRFGAFERYLAMPEGIDTDKIEAKFKKGVLTVTLPKTEEARKAEKKIPVKPA
jgi:HSP20 family protein